MDYKFVETEPDSSLKEKISEHLMGEYKLVDILSIARDSLYVLALNCEVQWNILKDIRDKDMVQYLTDNPLILIDILSTKNFLKSPYIRMRLKDFLPKGNKMIDVCMSLKVVEENNKD